MLGPILTALHDHVVLGTLYVLLALIGADLVTGVASAIRRGVFNTTFLSDFIQGDGAKFASLVLALGTGLVTTPSAYNLVTGAFVAAAATFAASLIASVVQNADEAIFGHDDSDFDKLLGGLIRYLVGIFSPKVPGGVTPPPQLPAPAAPVTNAAPVAAVPATAATLVAPETHAEPATSVA